MYFILIGLFLKEISYDKFWVLIGALPDNFEQLNWIVFRLKNSIPVTIENIIDGGGLIGGVFIGMFSESQAKSFSIYTHLSK